MSPTRDPQVAGLFYPVDKDQLQAELKTCLKPSCSNLPKPKALIVPHAGYVYSGEVAGKGYALLRDLKDTVKQVVLFGPAHRLYFKGIATTNCDTFRTPLGAISVNKDSTKKATDLQNVVIQDKAFDGEHCLEVQLPFLQTVLDDFSITPFIVGDCDSQAVAELMSLLWGEEDTLIIISSDLSHFLSYEDCVIRDKTTASSIMNKAFDKIKHHDACGRLPIQGLLRVANEKGLQVNQIDVRNSGDTAGNKDRVVGYGTWALF